MAGVYGCLRVLEPSSIYLDKYVKDCGIPQFSDMPYHSTLIVDHEGSHFIPMSESIHRARPIGLGVFKSQTGTNCLVLHLSAPTMIFRHVQLVVDHDLIHAFPDYRPHVTLSYDIGNFNYLDLPNFEREIILGDETLRPVFSKPSKSERWNKIQKMLSASM